MCEPVILPSHRLREHQDRLEDFIHIARHGLETLYQQVAGMGYCLLLTDARGVTVDFIGAGAGELAAPVRARGGLRVALAMLARSPPPRDPAMSTRASLQGFAHAWLRGWLALAAACAIAANAAAQSPVRSIDVAYDGETYVVKAQMFAPVSQAIAWDVLTDFTHMAAWVPNVRESSIVRPGDKQMTIEQSGIAKFGLLSFSYTSLREIVLNPQTTIESTQIKGSMRRQQSVMTLSTEGDGTRLQYQLELVPSGLASTVLSQDRLKHDIEEQFTAIVGEMIRRKK
jgi:hypothetical protein